MSPEGRRLTPWRGANPRYRAITTAACIGAVLVAVAVFTRTPWVWSTQAEEQHAGQVVLTRVVDGDTVVVTIDGALEANRVRLLGINAPEADECFGDRATAALAELARPPVAVILTSDRHQRESDRYGRTLAYVSVGEVDLGEALIRGGHATARHDRPPVSRAGRYASAEAEARAAGRGLWTRCPAAGEPRNSDRSKGVKKRGTLR